MAGIMNTCTFQGNDKSFIHGSTKWRGSATKQCITSTAGAYIHHTVQQRIHTAPVFPWPPAPHWPCIRHSHGKRKWALCSAGRTRASRCVHHGSWPRDENISMISAKRFDVIKIKCILCVRRSIPWTKINVIYSVRTHRCCSRPSLSLSLSLVHPSTLPQYSTSPNWRNKRAVRHTVPN